MIIIEGAIGFNKQESARAKRAGDEKRINEWNATIGGGAGSARNKSSCSVIFLLT